MRFAPALAVVLALLVLAGPALACGGCKEGVAAQADEGAQANAYGWSVIGMLVMPYLLAGGIGFAIMRASRTPPPAPPVA